MKREQVHFLHELLIVVGNHVFLMMFPLTIIGMFPGRSSYMGLWGALVLLPLAFYGLREKEKRSFLFTLWHFLIVAVCIFLPIADVVARVCVVLLSIFYLGMSFYIRLHKEDAKDGICHPVLPFIVGTVLMYIQGSHGNGEFVEYYLWLTVIFYICYIVAYYVLRYLFFVSMNEKTAEKVPEKEIFGSGMGYVLLFVGGSTLCMLLSVNVTLLDRVVGWIKGVVSYLLGLFLHIYESDNDTFMEDYSSVEPGDIPFEEAAEPGMFWLVLEKIMYVILAVIIIVVIAAVVKQIVRLIMYGFSAGKRKKTVMLQSHEDIREKLSPEKKKGTGREPLRERLSYRGRIRALYKRTAIGQRKLLIGEKSLHVLSYFTAKECCEQIGRDGLKEAYEKARYSDAECTREDVSRSKN